MLYREKRERETRQPCSVAVHAARSVWYACPGIPIDPTVTTGLSCSASTRPPAVSRVRCARPPDDQQRRCAGLGCAQIESGINWVGFSFLVALARVPAVCMAAVLHVSVSLFASTSHLSSPVQISFSPTLWMLLCCNVLHCTPRLHLHGMLRCGLWPVRMEDCFVLSSYYPRAVGDGGFQREQTSSM